MKKIQVGFLLSYDYEKLRHSIPPVYAGADQIFIAIDKDRRTWSGQQFEISPEFFQWLETFDTQKKITVYRDDFYVKEISAIQNDSRERHMLALQMGIGNWIVQVDADEIFIDFGKFVHTLRKHDRFLDRPQENPVQIAGYLINIYKYLEDGLLYVDQPTKVMLATNYPNYKVARKTKERIIYTDNILLHESLSRTEEELRFKFTNWGHNDEINASFFDKWKSATKENYTQLRDLFYLNPSVWKKLGYLPTKDIHALKDVIAQDDNLKVSGWHLFSKNFGQWFKTLKIMRPNYKPGFEPYVKIKNP